VQEEVEKQTKANQKLQEQQDLMVKMEKMAVVGRITASIAHSIRNPLAAIGGFARLLLKSKDIIKTKEYLEFILNEAEHLDDVLEEVLNYSESLHPVMDSWDVNQLAIAVTNEMAPRLKEMQVAVDLRLAPDLPTAWLDYKQISYCLKTIINHVATHPPDVDRIEVEISFNDECIMLCVNDNGVSLSEEMKNDLMTPFMEADLGQGIGLPLCRVILDRHGSSLDIKDRPGGGTKYCIILQQHKEDQRQ
jgi:signal transduction histidine kinase